MKLEKPNQQSSKKNSHLEPDLFQRQQNEYYWFERTKSALLQEESVKSLIFINAEVRLIKCVIDRVPIDISFNRISGLCTLCFLEEIDAKIGRGHLFKRSVILVKSWGLYESRILASHNALLSTYAITVLVLFILNRFHQEISEPIEILLKFLEYFSNFNWDDYGICIEGSLDLAQLPNIVITDTISNPLFEKQFLEECQKKYDFPKYSPAPYAFQRKFLNVVDPLKATNNLGRGVSKNNSLRIRKAFKKGYQDLKAILTKEVDLSLFLSSFFKNTVRIIREREKTESPKFWEKQDDDTLNTKVDLYQATLNEAVGLLEDQLELSSSSSSQNNSSFRNPNDATKSG